MKFDKKQITDVKLEGIDAGDYPDFVDAYIVSALYKGEPMTEEQLEKLNEDSEFVYEKVIDKLF